MLLCSALVLAAALRAQEPPPAPVPEPERAFVEVEIAPREPWLQQPCELTIRIGVDAAWFAAHAVPLFRQQLDRPFVLDVPWLLGAADRAVTLLPPAADAATERIALGDRVVPASRAGTRTTDGRAFDLLEVRCRWVPLADGTSPIAPVELRYAHASRFEDDFLRGRQPIDRREHSVRSAPDQLRVRPLPIDGRPAGFAGAVGEFTLQARTAATAVAVGDSFEVELELGGRGNFERLAPPPPPPLSGFHVQGVRDRRGASGRTFVLDVLALREGATAVPPIEVATFSPAAGRYVVLASVALPLRVGPPAPGTVLPPAVQALVDADAAATASNPWGRRGVLVVAIVAALLLRRNRQRRWRARAQWTAAVRDLEQAGGAVARLAAFERLLALRAGAAAWGDAAAGWSALAAAGVPEPVLARVRQLHAALDAARFGGVAPAAAEVAEVARALTVA
ncbi:MAG: BatD family protein [Planctomycetes bacterium]|nr:BatD family protein [Planctomycetota bacterium]